MVNSLNRHPHSTVSAPSSSIRKQKIDAAKKNIDAQRLAHNAIEKRRRDKKRVEFQDLKERVSQYETSHIPQLNGVIEQLQIQNQLLQQRIVMLESVLSNYQTTIFTQPVPIIQPQDSAIPQQFTPLFMRSNNLT